MLEVTDPDNIQHFEPVFAKPFGVLDFLCIIWVEVTDLLCNCLGWSDGFTLHLFGLKWRIYSTLFWVEVTDLLWFFLGWSDGVTLHYFELKWRINSDFFLGWSDGFVLHVSELKWRILLFIFQEWIFTSRSSKFLRGGSSYLRTSRVVQGYIWTKCLMLAESVTSGHDVANKIQHFRSRCCKQNPSLPAKMLQTKSVTSGSGVAERIRHFRSTCCKQNPLLPIRWLQRKSVIESFRSTKFYAGKMLLCSLGLQSGVRSKSLYWQSVCNCCFQIIFNCYCWMSQFPLPMQNDSHWTPAVCCPFGRLPFGCAGCGWKWCV